MTELPGRLIHEFKDFEQDIDKVRLFLLTRFVESNFADYDAWNAIIRRKIEETWKVHPPKSHFVSHIRDRVSQMEKLLQDTTVGCPGAADIWRGIRALVQTGEALYLGIISD